MNRFIYLAIFLIIILAAFLRLWDLRDIPPGLYHDEAMNVNQAREAWRDGDFSIFYPENNGREGLFINIQAFSLAAFGFTPLAARLPSALFGILTVLGVFFLTKELFRSDRVALFASFFLATSFWHILFSRIGFRAIMAPFFLVWSMYFLLKLISFKLSAFSNKNSAESWGLAAVSCAVAGGLLFGLGFHSYIAYRVAPLLLIVPFLAGRRIYKRKENKEGCMPCLLALFLFFAFIAALPLGLYFLENPADFVGRSSQVSIFSSETPLRDLGKNIMTTLGMFFSHGDYNWRHNFAGSPQLWWSVSILFLIGVFGNWKLLARRSPRLAEAVDEAQVGEGGEIGNFAIAYAFIVSWFLIFLLPVVLSNEGLPHALRALPLVIPAVIFAALGLEWIIDKIKQWFEHKKEFILLLAVFFAAIAMHGFNQYFLRWANHPDVYAAFNGSYTDLGRYLNTLPSTTQKYIIVNTPGHMLAGGIPMSAQTVMFFTDTWNKTERAKKQFIYIPSTDNLSLLPQTLSSPTVIAILENDPALRRELKARYPELMSTITDGGLILTNLK